MSQYYYTDGKERFGPFSVDELKGKDLQPDTLVWKEGLADWMPAKNVTDLQALFDVGSFQPSSPAMSSVASPPLAPPKNWLIESILVTILCCLPLGIVGIIHATKVDTLWKTGQHDAALKASQEAGKWVKIAFILGLIVIGLYLVFIMFGVMAGIGAGLDV